jgi:hypothetical protein
MRHVSWWATRESSPLPRRERQDHKNAPYEVRGEVALHAGKLRSFVQADAVTGAGGKQPAVGQATGESAGEKTKCANTPSLA